MSHRTIVNKDSDSRFVEDSGEASRHHNPAVFWLLIVIMLIILAGAVTILDGPINVASQTSQVPATTPEVNLQPRIYTISYQGGVFSPTNLRIHAGDTVRLKNEGFFGIRVITDNNQLPGFDSIGDIPQGSYFSYTFAEKGIFGYHNSNKPDEQGTVIVR